MKKLILTILISSLLIFNAKAGEKCPNFDFIVITSVGKTQSAARSEAFMAAARQNLTVVGVNSSKISNDVYSYTVKVKKTFPSQ